MTFASSAVTLVGPAGEVPLTFTPGPAGSRAATWSFPALSRGMYTLVISGDGVVDLNGNEMAGNYTRRFGVLPGDFDGNGLVDGRDLNGIKKRYQSNPALANRFADINGDGVVNVQDYNLARAALRCGWRGASRARGWSRLRASGSASAVRPGRAGDKARRG